ncbi:MAG TPA: MurR/RpiR family transcriptional regulator [Dongiaceae bacterium]|nr:MurR/RpiR family transcriptional regulator [Dongiaceae bacterium]
MSTRKRGGGDGPLDPRSFEGRIMQMLPALSPTELRVARFFLERRESLLLGSALEIAELAGASDATVVRTARSLGFEGLAELRAAALAGLTKGAPSPSGRLRRTLDQAGGDPKAALHHVLAAHDESLRVLREPAFAARFAEAVATLQAAPRRWIFGIGPSGAMADYAALQLNRIGLRSVAVTATGIALADRLIGLAKGDAVLMFAYAPIYREVSVTLKQAADLAIPVALVSDSLGPFVGGKVDAVLPVPRGRAGNLSMHGATLVTVEALVTALAAARRDQALSTLESLAEIRGTLDKDWRKRGVPRTRRAARKS